MTNKEILEKFKTLFSKEAEVEMAEEPKKEVAPAQEAAPQVAPEVTVEYATKSDIEEIKKQMNSEVSDVKAMFEQILNIVQPKEQPEVPAGLSKEKEEEIEVEAEIIHSPEVEEVKQEEAKVDFYKSNRPKTMKDTVTEKFLNLKNK